MQLEYLKQSGSTKMCMHEAQFYIQEGSCHRIGRVSEGVGIVLGCAAAKAWRDGGEQREPARELKSCHSQAEASVFMPQPSALHNKQLKDEFFEDVQMTIDKVLERDLLMIIGDWNARVGFQLIDDQWEGVLGKHGLGKANEAALLQQQW